MKNQEIFKANGITFYSYEEVEKYARENGYKITNTQCVNFGKKRVHFIDLSK